MASIKKNGNSMGLPMNINRGNPIPLDTTEIWYSLAEAQAYARTGATAYVGQRISVVDEEEQTVSVYVIANTEGNLVKISGGSENQPITGKLTIGPYVYDGTSDVIIGLYDGDYESVD